MAQGIDLVIGNGLDADELLQIRLIILARGHDGEARTGERDFGRGSKLIDHAVVSRLAAERQDVPEGDELAVKLVDAVGVVPHEGKIGRRGLQCRDARDRLVGIDDAVGVGVFRHAPHTLDRRVLHGLLDLVHIGADRGHGNCNEFKAERFGDFKMAVVAGRRAEPLDGIQPAPRLFRACKAVRIALADQIVHERQRRVAADEALLRFAAEYVRPVFLRFFEAGKLAVVAGVDAAGNAVLRGFEDAQDAGDEVKLLPAGLASCHVELQLLRLQRVELRLDCCVFLAQLCGCQILICSTHAVVILSSIHSLQRRCLIYSVYRVRLLKASKKPVFPRKAPHSGC